MKKFLSLTLITIITLFSTLCFSACESIDDAFTPLKLTDEKKYVNATIDASATTYVITPAEFDLEALNKQGYKMTIRVTYDVYYKKSWDVLWDIGYLGAPKYEVYILDDSLIGKCQEDITAPSKNTTKTISYTTDIVNLIGSKIFLIFSSNNIQNIIYFKNITVSYDCYK